MDQFLYYVNCILRNVVSCRRIGEIYSKSSIREWLIGRGFDVVSSLQTRSLLASDQCFDSEVAIDFLVCLEPFEDLSVDEIASCLKFMKMSSVGCLLMIPTLEFHKDDDLGQLIPISEWINILDQLGTSVHVYDSERRSVFLILRNSIS